MRVSGNMTPNIMYKPIFFFILIFIITSSSCISQTNQVERIREYQTESHQFPKPIGLVNDFAFILDSIKTKLLEKKLENFKELTTNQIAIVTLDAVEITEENFDKYALDLSNNWGVGTKEKNNGLTIVLSPKLRKIRINTGLGVEHILTDTICKKIIEEVIIPDFRKGNYYEGLDKATDELIKLWK